jgi:hypothetical protein
MASTIGIGRRRLSAACFVLLAACGSGGTAPDPGSGGSTGVGASGGAGGQGGRGQSANGGGGAVPVDLPSCGDIPDCGGDPEGTWAVESGCLNVLRSFYTEPGCEDMLSAATVEASGTYIFLQGTITYDLDLIVHQELSVSDACARSGTGFNTAREACTTLEASYASTASVDSATCSVAANGRCECSLTYLPQHWLDSGLYEIRSNRIYDAGGSGSEFCIADDTMSFYLENVSDPPAPGDTGILLELGRN